MENLGHCAQLKNLSVLYFPFPETTPVRKLLNAEKEAERKARTRHLIQLGALFEIANLDQRDPAELLGILLKTAEIDPNDMKWQIWKDLGQETLNQRKKDGSTDYLV